MNKQAWISCALEKGFESFEIYQETSSERTLRWFEHQMDSFVTSKVTGTALRGVYKGKVVNLATEDTADENMESYISKMIEQAESINAEVAGIIRKPQETEEAVSTKNWVRPTNEEIKKVLACIEDKVLGYDPRVTQVFELQYRETSSSRTITNSYGMDVKDTGRLQALIVGAAVEENGEVKDEMKIETVENLADLDIDEMVKDVCEKALGKLNSSRLKSAVYPVILDRRAMTSLFSAFSGIFSGDLIGKGI